MPVVKVSHEALIRYWPRLTRWVKDNQDFLTWQERLQPDIENWNKNNQTESWLLRDARLNEAQQILDTREDYLRDKETVYIKASIDLRNREIAKKERERQEKENLQKREFQALQAKQRTTRHALTGAVIALLIVSLFGYFAWKAAENERAAKNAERTAKIEAQNAAESERLAKNAERQAKLDAQKAAESERLAKIDAQKAAESERTAKNNERRAKEQAENQRNELLKNQSHILAEKAQQQLSGLYDDKPDHPATAMRLALEALPETSSDYPQRPYVKEAQNQLYAAVEQHWRGIWEHDGQVGHVQFSPDGKLLLTATGSSDPQNPAFGNDAYIWEFPSGKLRHVLRGHTQSVFRAYFSPDAQKVLTVSFDDTARLWDVTTGKQLAVIGGKHLPIRPNSLPLEDTIYAAFSPDGQHIALTSPETNDVYLYDAETGQELLTLEGHGERTYSVNFNPEGTRIVTTSNDNTARVWDAKTGRQLLILNKDEKIYFFERSPDGQRNAMLPSSKNNCVYLQALGQDVTLKGCKDVVASVNFSFDGTRIITTFHDNTARVWDVKTGQQLFILNKDEKIVVPTDENFASFESPLSLSDSPINTNPGIVYGQFSPDGKKIITINRHGKAVLWDTETGKKLITFSGHKNTLWKVAFSPDGKRIATALNTEARLWDAETGQELVVLKGHKNTIYHISFSPYGEKIVTTSEDKTARLWSGQDGKEIRVLSGHNRGLNYAAFSPDGAWLATASNDKTVRIWNVNTGLPPGIIPTQEISDVQFIANGKRAVSCDYLWASDGQALAKLDTCYHAFSQDQSKLFVYGQGGATLYDTNTGQKTATFPLNSRSGFANFSPDGKRLVTSFGGLTQIWDTATGKEIVALEKRVSCSAMLKNIDYYIESYYQESKGCAVFNSDGSKIVTVSNHVARIWEVSTGQELFVLKHEDYLYGAAFSPDSKLVVVAADRNVQVWDVATGQKLAVLRDGGDRNINALFFTPDGKLLTASGPTLHLWDMETSKEIAVMSGHTKTIWEIGLTDNGEKIISFAKSQGIEERRFWDAKTGKALEQTCAAYEKHGASLTAAFRSRISKEEVSDDNFSVFISFVLNSYCPPEETGLSIASFEKLQFWMPLFSDLKALTEAAHQFIGRHEWTCDERRKFLLNTDNCPLDPPVPDGMDQATAKYWRMAKAGDVEMQYVTSLNYSNGKGVPANPEKRLEWLRKAAEGGHPAAQAILGLDYWEGYGVQQDRKEAAKWFLRAAERGQLDAQFMMCVVYYAGLGMTKDGKEAFKWCTKVVEKQNFSEDYRTTTGSAYYFLGNMYQNGYGVDQDFEKAAKFYKVASLGNEDAIKPVVVTSISANSQAEKLGIQVGDVFTHYEGKPVLNTNFFIAYRNAEPDEGLPKELKVQRDGETLIFQVLPGKIGVNLQDK